MQFLALREQTCNILWQTSQPEGISCHVFAQAHDVTRHDTIENYIIVSLCHYKLRI